jgi:hypothetical protein
MIPIRITRWCRNFKWGFGFHDNTACYGYYCSDSTYESAANVFLALKTALDKKPHVTIRQCLIDDGEPEMTPLDLNNDTECIAFILRYS